MLKYSYKIIGILASISCCLLLSCRPSETDEITIDFGYDYYPLAIGKSWIYQVDSVIYRPGLQAIVKDSSTSFLREIVTDTTTDLGGELLYIIERYRRSSEKDVWEISKVFTRSKTERRALQTEDNLRFVKLAFPLTQGASWDGNAFLDAQRLFSVGGEFIQLFKNWQYIATQTGAQDTIGGVIYSDVSSVRQADLDVATDYRFAREKYARDVGLVFREWFIADSQCNYCCNGNQGPVCQDTPWDQRAEKGFYLKQTLLSYQ